MKQEIGGARMRVALAAAGVVVLAVLLGGILASAAAAAPDASQLDAYLAEHGSPMTGTGATFIAQGEAYGVDPRFLVAIAGAESDFGRFLYAESGDQATYNAFNWFYGPTWPTSDFGSWDEAIARVAQGLAGPLYYGAGLYSVDAIAPTYCPVGTEAWVANVKAFMTELGADPSDTRVAVSGDAASSLPAPQSTAPGLVALAGSVKLDHGDRVVGQRIYAWFTLTNTGGQPATLQGIRLAVRGPSSVVRDLVSDKPLTLAGGASVEVSTSWLLDLAGRWHGWIEVTQGGKSVLVGDHQAFAFWVRLPKTEQLHRWHDRNAILSKAL